MSDQCLIIQYLCLIHFKPKRLQLNNNNNVIKINNVGFVIIPKK